ncbi:MAG: DUF2959 family protein [Bernardetiaceae bacterium]|nr:DUF2959 family protein [Bernardetiaceae bacterium]
MKLTFRLFFLLLLLSTTACMYSPEDLPRFKKKFKKQIESFSKQKEKTDELVIKSVEKLSALQQAIANARNVDKEFNQVYGSWERVNNKVKKLNKEYEQLRSRAEELFLAIEKQVNGLNDENNKRQLLAALAKSRQAYEQQLVKTEKAIGKLRTLHTLATDNIKALEAAVAIGQIGEINTGLSNIESQVSEIMNDLDMTVNESKKLYEQRMGEL